MSLPNKHSALSGDDNIGELIGEFPERDLKLEEGIRTKLRSLSEINVDQVRVKVKDRFASITGTVQSVEQREQVRKTVENFPGIEDVSFLLDIVQH